MTNSDNASSVNQSNASAQGDMIGRDKITNTTNQFERRKSQIESWMEKLAQEISSNEKTQEMVDSLQYFKKKYSVDGIDGLENKLEHAGRGKEQIAKALMRKEEFSKLLDKYGLYGSAQEIFAFLLSRVEHLFEVEVTPLIGHVDDTEIEKLIQHKVVSPVLDEMSQGVFAVNNNHASGMVYWLAEQCFIRWHK
ncbi:hypothetical protein TH30_13090 [Thalassospira profundimaris]|uniref:ABC-three component systems C-terminal domain-containing protein n=1 Tax=Thalassospira profundimaris TaxID=502049 RepID=A0A367WVL6_9PROT|nr:hypothetical protein TH30_13090 [Thalassospira profundimaris]